MNMELDKDIHTERTLEAMYDHIRTRMTRETGKKCPVVRYFADVLAAMKLENNERIVLDIGVIDCKELDCPCFKRKG